MEENKTKVERNASGNGGNAGNGGRKRRNRHHHGNHPRSENAQTPQNGEKPAQSGQQKQNQGQNPNKQGGQNQNAQNKQGGQNQSQGKQNGQNGKPSQKQAQKQPQKGQKQQNGGGRDKANDKKEENRKDTYLYVLDGNLYVNLTNKCSNACDFCVRNERTSYYGNYLWLKNGDPTAEKVIAATNGFGDLTRFKEVVFCGFGEPTYRVAEMAALCDYFHGKGLHTRLNTNGQGNLINKRDIVPEIKGKIDFVNISLNASCYEKYQPICRSQFREAGFAGILDFAKACCKNGVACRFSIVDCIGEEEVEACKRLAQSVNVPLYVRSYITDS